MLKLVLLALEESRNGQVAVAKSQRPVVMDKLSSSVVITWI